MHVMCSAIKEFRYTWCPHIILCAAIITDFIPEAHTLFTVVVGVVIGSPVKHKYHSQPNKNIF